MYVVIFEVGCYETPTSGLSFETTVAVLAHNLDRTSHFCMHVQLANPTKNEPLQWETFSDVTPESHTVRGFW